MLNLDPVSNYEVLYGQNGPIGGRIDDDGDSRPGRRIHSNNTMKIRKHKKQTKNDTNTNNTINTNRET